MPREPGLPTAAGADRMFGLRIFAGSLFGARPAASRLPKPVPYTPSSTNPAITTMTLEALRNHCLAKKAVTEDFPFDESTLVMRVMGKMFALISTTSVPLSVNLKCDPELAIELRDRYDAVEPGYHQNKKHWNTVTLDGSIPMKELKGMIDHSYDLVVKGLKKADREALAG
jgi:predicted DNA-binding protein (MmcQ/YjbR family)